MFKLILVLIFVIATVSSVDPNDKWAFVRRRLESSRRSADDADQSNWLPNSDKIGNGYNPAQGSPVCYTGDCQMSGFAMPIFKLNHTKRTFGSCVDMLIPENTNIDCLPSTDTTSSTDVISNLRQFKESLEKGIEIQATASGTYFGFSVSASYSHSEQTRSMVDTIVREKLNCSIHYHKNIVGKAFFVPTKVRTVGQFSLCHTKTCLVANLMHQ